MRVATCLLSKWSTLCARFVRASGEWLAGPRSSSFCAFQDICTTLRPRRLQLLGGMFEEMFIWLEHYKQTISDQSFSLREPKFVLCGVELCFHFF